MSRPIVASGRQSRRERRRAADAAAPSLCPGRRRRVNRRRDGLNGRPAWARASGRPAGAGTAPSARGHLRQRPQASGEDPRLLAAVLRSRGQERTGELPVLVDLDRDADLVPLDPLGGDQRPVEGGLDDVLGLEGEAMARTPRVRVDAAVLERGVADLARDGAVLTDRERERQLLRLAPVDRDLGVALPASDHRRGGRDRSFPARRRDCGDSHQQRDDQRVAAHGRTPPPCVSGAVRNDGLRMRLINCNCQRTDLSKLYLSLGPPPTASRRAAVPPERRGRAKTAAPDGHGILRFVITASDALKRWPLLVVVAVAVHLAFGILGRGLWKPDEPREAAIAARMARPGGDLVVPHLGDAAFCEKPPLYYWVAAGSARLFGRGAVALRLPNALYALAGALLVGALAAAAAGRAAALAAGVAIGTLYLAYRVEIWVATDALLIFSVAGALLGCYRGLAAARGWRKLGWYALMHAFLAAGFLTKNVVAWIVPALALLAFVAWERRWRELLAWELWAGLAIQAAATAATIRNVH